LRPKDIYDTLHPHPTLPESFVEAVRDSYHKAILLPVERKVAK
jgi:hypothetical protein